MFCGYNLVLSVLWSMLFTNSLLYLCDPMSLWISYHSLSTDVGRVGLCRSSRSAIVARISAGTSCVYRLRVPVGV